MLEDTKESLKRQEKLAIMVKRERDGLKSILDSYNEEDALNSNYDKQKTARIRELEKALAEKEEQWNEAKKADETKLAELELLRFVFPGIEFFNFVEMKIRS